MDRAQLAPEGRETGRSLSPGQLQGDPGHSRMQPRQVRICDLTDHTVILLEGFIFLPLAPAKSGLEQMGLSQPANVSW